MKIFIILQKLFTKLFLSLDLVQKKFKVVLRNNIAHLTKMTI